MANKVLLKKSSVSSKVPQTTDLDFGEVALNYADGKLYFKNSSNQIKHFDAIPSILGLGNSSIEFGTDVSGNPVLNFTLNGAIVATMTVDGLTMSQPINMGNNVISALGSPVVSTDAATKSYADGAAQASAYPKGDYGGFSGSSQDAFGVSLTPLIQYDNMTPVGTMMVVDFGAIA